MPGNKRTKNILLAHTETSEFRSTQTKIFPLWNLVKSIVTDTHVGSKRLPNKTFLITSIETTESKFRDAYDRNA